MITDDDTYAHHYKIRDEQGKTLAQHGGIWLLELSKFNPHRIESEEQRWLQFFKVGEQLNDETLPDWMATQEMKQAMNTLSTFSEKERQYFQYQARQEFLREQRAIQLAAELAKQKMEQASQKLEETSQELEQTSRELEQTKQKLAQVNGKLEQTEQELLQVKQLALKEKQVALAEIARLKAQLAKEQ